MTHHRHYGIKPRPRPAPTDNGGLLFLAIVIWVGIMFAASFGWIL
jgi:hypothetical protein